MDRATAESEIAKILQPLEYATGAEVEAVTFIDIECTRMEDSEPQFARRVSIEVRPHPQYRWAT